MDSSKRTHGSTFSLWNFFQRVKFLILFSFALIVFFNSAFSQVNLPKKIDVFGRNKELDDTYFSASTKCFFIESRVYEAVSRVREIASGMENMFKDFFGEKVSFDPQICISVYDEAIAKFEGDVILKISKNLITIDVKWRKDLQLDDLLDKMVESYLSAYVLCNGRDEAYIPYWQHQAFVMMMKQRISNGTALDVSLYLSANKPDALHEVLSYSKSNQKNVRHIQNCSYMALLSLQSIYSYENPRLVALMRENLLNNDAKKTAGEVAAFRKSENFEILWRCILLGEINSRLGGVKSLENSDYEVLSRVSFIYFDDKDIPHSFTDKSVWENRKKIKSDLEQRIYEMKLAISWINPVYYNAFLSLGQLFQACLDDDEKMFLKSRENFISDLSLARDLSKKIKEITREHLN